MGLMAQPAMPPSHKRKQYTVFYFLFTLQIVFIQSLLHARTLFEKLFK